MMSPGEAGGEGGGGMSFAMLCQLISEGRAGEVQGVREIPDQLNVSKKTSAFERKVQVMT